MRIIFPLLVALVVAVPAAGADREPQKRECDSSQYGDLGRGWQKRAVLAGPVAFVGMRAGYRREAVLPVQPGVGRPYKVVVVVAPNAASTVRIGMRSRSVAALGYNEIRHDGGGPVQLSTGTQATRFEACGSEPSRAAWNRGTQFGGYFLVSGRRCVEVEVETGGKVLRRKLRFGVGVGCV